MTFFHKRVVLICEDSLLMEGIAETLRLRPDLKVVAVQPPIEPVALAELHPDLILVDDLQVAPGQITTLINSFPPNHNPPILRLNMDTQSLTVHSTKQFPAFNLSDLERVFEAISRPIESDEMHEPNQEIN